VEVEAAASDWKKHVAAPGALRDLFVVGEGS